MIYYATVIVIVLAAGVCLYTSAPAILTHAVYDRLRSGIHSLSVTASYACRNLIRAGLFDLFLRPQRRFSLGGVLMPGPQFIPERCAASL